MAKFKLNPFAQTVGPAFRQARVPMAVVEAKGAMLRCAINNLTQGEAAVAKSKDPFGDGPFGYNKTATGFELTSQLKQRDQAVKLIVGGD